MPTPIRIGAFTEYAARLSAHGDYSPDGVTDKYTVLLADPDARLDLDDVSGLPAIGDAHPLDDNLTVSEYRVGEHQPGELFRTVEVVYTQGEEESEGSGSSATSIGKLTALDYPIYTQTGDLVTDQINGGEVKNSAGDVFDGVPQFETLFAGVHFTRRVRSFPSAALALSGSLNSAEVKIYGLTFPARTARCRVTARYNFDGSSRPWEMDVTIEPRHNYVSSSDDFRIAGTAPADMSGYSSVAGRGYDLGWDLAILDCGFQYVDAVAGKLRFLVVDEAGNEGPAQLPQKLKQNGEDGRAYSHNSWLVVRVAKGEDWTALKAKENAPS